MTRVLIPQPDTEEDITAEQVAAPARCVCGHRKNSHRGATNRGSCKVTIHAYGPSNCPCSRFLDAASPKGLAVLTEQAERARRNIERDDEVVSVVVRAEQRHPSAVLADIVGPARAASVGRACAPNDRTLGRALCRFREAGARAQARGRRLSAEEAFEIATDDENSSAVHGAGESEE